MKRWAAMPGVWYHYLSGCSSSRSGDPLHFVAFSMLVLYVLGTVACKALSLCLSGLIFTKRSPIWTNWFLGARKTTGYIGILEITYVLPWKLIAS